MSDESIAFKIGTAIGVAVVLAFWVLVAIVVVHFIGKAW